MKLADEKIAFIGGGNMATAIAYGLIDKVPDNHIFIFDPNEESLAKHKKLGRNCFTVVNDELKNCSCVLLAVKPQIINLVAEQISNFLAPGALIISILAGTTLTKLEKLLPDSLAIIRCMPNTPMAIGQGMLGMSFGTFITDDHKNRAQAIFENSAKILQIPEERMNALTAISGSGPAYIFYFAELFMDAAQSLGFTQDEAQLLVQQTISGSVAYLDSKDGYPATQLREQVTSPGGTTAAALNTFKTQLPELFKDALQAAEKRGNELAES